MDHSFFQHLMGAYTSRNPEDVLSFISQMNSEGFSENIQLLTACQHEKLWVLVDEKLKYFISKCLGAEEEEENAQDAEEDEFDEETIIKYILCICSILQISLDKTALEFSEPLFHIVKILHEMIFFIGEGETELQDQIGLVCELWWTKDMPQKDELSQNLLILYLSRAFDSQAKASYVKKLFSLKEILDAIDLQDKKKEPLKKLVLNCFVTDQFLKNSIGCRFLSHVFTTNDNLIEDIHSSIKKRLPFISKKTGELYGDLYFRFWKDSSGENLRILENNCIQDLMSDAIHVPKIARCALPSVLNLILHHFHSQKKRQGIDEMLLRLYDPIIWRSLKAANPQVRANAAVLFFDAFPLMNPDSAGRENDAMLQKNFDLLAPLIADEHSNVRIVAVQGICRILNVYWEMIPPAAITELVQKLVNDMARDTSDPGVRLAVCDGIRYLLDNHLAVPTLTGLLENLANLIHDSSSKVRASFIDLLLVVKDLRAVKFWKIVPVHTLLYRLEVDPDPVASRITALLIKSYFPQEKDAVVQSERCLHILRNNLGAARRFYYFVVNHVSIQMLGQFQRQLCLTVIEFCDRKHMNIEEEEGGLTISDIEGYCDVIAVLCHSLSVVFSKTKNRYKKLQKKIFLSLQPLSKKLYLTFPDNENIRSATTIFAKYLPAEMVTGLNEILVSDLSEMEAEDPNLRMMIDLICISGQGKIIMNDYIMKPFIESNPGAKKKKEDVQVMLKSADFSKDLSKGLLILEHIMNSQSCVDKVFVKENMSNWKKLLGIMKSINQSTKRATQRFEVINLLYCQAILHLRSYEKSLKNCPNDFLSCFHDLANDCLLILSEEQPSEEQSQKRKVRNLEQSKIEFESGLRTLCDGLALGLLPSEASDFRERLWDIGLKALEGEEYPEEACKLIYQLIEGNDVQSDNLKAIKAVEIICTCCFINPQSANKTKILKTFLVSMMSLFLQRNFGVQEILSVILNNAVEQNGHLNEDLTNIIVDLSSKSACKNIIMNAIESNSSELGMENLMERLSGCQITA